MVVGGGGVYPSCRQAKAGLQPGQVASLSQGHTERQTAILTSAEFSVRLTCMFLWLWGEPGEPMQTQGEHANSAM